jgi:hypothetical protein
MTAGLKFPRFAISAIKNANAGGEFSPTIIRTGKLGPHPDSRRKLLNNGLAQSAELVHSSVAFPLIRECPHNSTSSKKARGNVIER